MQQRRKFLKHAVVLCGTGALSLAPIRVLSQSASLRTQRLSDRALVVHGPDSNALVVDSSEGLILVDGGHASWAADLQAAIADNFPGRPIRALINTHWHLDQTGSNAGLGERDIEIIAHENTALWMGTEIWQRWSGITYPPMPAAALPTTTFLDDGAMQIGDRYVQYGYMRNAHTDGDIWVYFEDEDILVTGGVVSNGRWPDIDWSTGGYVGGLLDGLVSLLTVPVATTKIVPSQGEVMALDALRAQNQMYLNVFDGLHGAFIQSESLEEILARNLAAEYEGQMGDATRFITLAYQSFQGHLRDPQNFRILNIP